MIVDLPPDLEYVACDDVHIEQVFFNLLDNAARYTPTGHDLAHCRRARRQDGQGRSFRRRSRDSTDDRARVFAPFERGTTLSEGTGLGLSIARGLIEAHGGQRIWLVDGRQARTGTSFAFTVPVWAPA